MSQQESRPEEFSTEIKNLVKELKARTREIAQIDSQIKTDKKNLHKARNALEELPRAIDRQRKRIKDKEAIIKGIEK